MTASSFEIQSILTEKQLDANPRQWLGQIQTCTERDVEKALTAPAGVYHIRKLAALVSPAGGNYLEDMAQIAHQLTRRRFGRTIRLYAPLYLSNYCTNQCLYCGFNRKNMFFRTRLTLDQALQEADKIASEKFREVLLVSGEDGEFITVDYLVKLVRRLRRVFSMISLEVYPLSAQHYTRLFQAGVDGVTLYQETYDRQAYRHYHPAGPKSDYDYRLHTPDRIASAGMREIGLGALLGLTDWRTETLALAEHAHYLMKRYWQSHISFSFPRIRPAQQRESSPEHLPTDKELVQMILALRLCFADAGLVLSTRESANLRDHAVQLGITKMSAGSKTCPGGYVRSEQAAEQFEISDTRTPGQVARMLRRSGLEPVWKDGDSSFVET